MLGGFWCCGFGLYIWVVWFIFVLWCGLVDVLVGIFDVVGFVMYVVLEVDLEFWVIFVFQYFIDVCWVVVLGGFGIFGQVYCNWD